MKKGVILFGACLGILTLSGCSNNEASANAHSQTKASSTMETTTKTKENTTSRSSEEKTSTTSSSSSAPVEVATSLDSVSTESKEQTTETNTAEQETATGIGWDSTKHAELETFMAHFSQAMDQPYTSYQPGNNANFYGLQFPEDVMTSTQKMPLAVDGQIASAEWGTSGNPSADYQIVAAYSDSQASGHSQEIKHAYLFGFKDEQPIVLVTSQNQGVENGAINFSPTENSELSNGFDSIAAGQPTGGFSDPTDTTPIVEQPTGTITTEEQAMARIKEVCPETATNDFVLRFYKMIGSDFLFDSSLTSIKAQGGTGSAGFYRVTPAGEVQTTDAYGTPFQ